MEPRLTPRRLEALDSLRRLTASAGDAVHYSLVAAGMRISDWTAYTLLRELEGMGLVTRRSAPAVKNTSGGRSRVLFLPRLAAAGPSTDEMQHQLKAAFERFAAIGDEAAAATAYLADARADLGYQLGFWLSRLEAAGRHAEAAARTVLEGGSLPTAKLQTVGAMGLGTALARLGATRLAASLAAASGRFNVVLEDAARASDQTLASLVDAARNLTAESTSEGVTT